MLCADAYAHSDSSIKKTSNTLRNIATEFLLWENRTTSFQTNHTPLRNEISRPLPSVLASRQPVAGALRVEADIFGSPGLYSVIYALLE